MVSQHVGTAQALLRLLLGFGLGYAIGFERELRGSVAGDRTFALIGVAGVLSGLFAVRTAGPVAFSGIVTGVGFIGAAITVRARPDSGVRGLTTAATILLTVAVGAACGAGLLVVSTVATALALLVLELRWVPGLRRLNASWWTERFRDETADGGRGELPGSGGPQG